MNRLSKTLFILITLSLTIGLVSANQFSSDPSYFLEKDITVQDNWSEYLDLSPNYISDENGTLVYNSSDENRQTLLETDKPIYSEVSTNTVDVAGTGNLELVIRDSDNYIKSNSQLIDNSVSSVSFEPSGSTSLNLFDRQSLVGFGGEVYPFTIGLEDMGDVNPEETTNVTFTDQEGNDIVVYADEDGTTQQVANTTQGWTDYTFPNSSVDSVEIYAENSDGQQSNSINKYYNSREDLFQSSFGYYEIDSLSMKTYHSTNRIESYGINSSEETEYGTTAVGDGLIQFTENVDVGNDSITVIDSSQKGKVQFESDSSKVLLDVSLEGNSNITSNDLGNLVYTNGSYEKDGITAVIKESGVYEFESDGKFTTMLELNEDTNLAINEISKTGQSEQPPEIGTFLVGQDIDGVVNLQEDGVYQDYYHRDGEVSYIHASRYFLNLDTGNIIDQTEWKNVGEFELGSTNENAQGNYSINYTDEFNYKRYTEGEYAVGIMLVRSDNQVAGESVNTTDYTVSDWEGYNHSVVERKEVPFGVVSATEPVGLLTSIENFFNGIIESIVSSISTVFSEGEIQNPSLENPPQF